jgi:phosphatidylserine/phosphatidylglycerophosphate/cardiolipin synthase-like enzyme
MRKLVWKAVRYTVIVAWFATMLWQTNKPLPEGMDVNSASIAMPQDRIQFLRDITARDAWGRRVVDQQIFDAVFAIVDSAQRFVVLDFFLLNDDMGSSHDGAHRPLSRELAERLLARKHAQPQLQILLITDPINDVYGGRPSPLLSELQRGGIDVVRTNLNSLRDSNPMYSSAWRIGAQWFGNSAGGGWLPDPFRDQGVVSLRSWLSLANFKANHRKTIVADTADGDLVGIITSANPHDASSLHSNVAWQFRGELAQQVLASEIAIAHFSGWRGEFQMPTRLPETPAAVPRLEVAYVTEDAIRTRIVEAIRATSSSETIDLAMFYLSDREIIEALESAAARGVKVRVILDPNKDAFGVEKDGVPNRPVANELVTDSNGAIEVRWYRTQGEQFHTKLVLVRHGKQLDASLGSANLTRRNVGNYNLEANVHVSMPADSPLARQLTQYFDSLWSNDETKHIEYTAPFGAYKDDSQFTYWRFRIMEATGLSSF